MLGAIIGDLSVWTWINNRSEFYSSLISKDSKLSEMTIALVGITHVMQQKEQLEWRNIYSYLFSYYRENRSLSHCSSDWNTWLEEGKNIISDDVKMVLHLATIIYCGWFDKPIEQVHKLNLLFHGNKETYYLSQLAVVISRLRHGLSKEEAIKGIDYISNWNEIVTPSPLGYAYYAWQCFSHSWDFTSAIHNAMRCNYGNKHILGALVGALSDAMYGCERGLIKKKYSDDISFLIEIPFAIKEVIDPVLTAITSFQRHFFPKNSALTNVEVHQWTAIKNVLQDQRYNEKQYSSILKSFYTGWDCRYGLYLDDGWCYVYRSFHLLFRFKMHRENDGMYKVICLEKAEKGNDLEIYAQQIIQEIFNKSIYH